MYCIYFPYLQISLHNMAAQNITVWTNYILFNIIIENLKIFLYYI